MTKEHIIWSNKNLNLEDWRTDHEKEYLDCSEEEFNNIMYDTNASYLDDARFDLNIQLSQPILMIADLGLWNGRRMGYKEIRSGNIRDCLCSNCEYTIWYLDRNGDFCCDDVHHDGTNHYCYRVYKENVSEAQKEWLKEKLYAGTASKGDIALVTRKLGGEISKIYGWTKGK